MIIIVCLREFSQKFENKQCLYRIMKAIFAFEFILRLI